MKKGIIISLILLTTIVCCISAVSAGLFDFEGGDENEDIEWDLGPVLISFPYSVEVENITESADADDELNYFSAHDNETDEDMFIAIFPEKDFTIDKYISGAGLIDEGTYNSWRVLHNKDDGYKYELHATFKDIHVEIAGDDLDELKKVADTVKSNEN